MSDESAPLFKKSRRRGANIRKRAADNSEAAGNPVSEEAAAIVRSDEGPRAAKQIKATAATKLDRETASKSDDSQPADSVEYHYKRAVDATRTEEVDAPVAKLNPTKAQGSADGDEGLYKGKNAYTNRAVGTGTLRAGPVRGPTNVRTTNIVDYQPNVCKDYKETGYCGYGDSCIFLHDRGVYKTGWQLEQEFEESQRGVRHDNPRMWQTPGSDSEDSKKPDPADIPFACLICRKPFSNPVVTKCQHYFCEACALARYRKSPKCHACGAATGGVFKKAKNLVKP
ncbi:RNA-splicing factor [Coemansia sp. RSA 2706]|nr:RNA-splicing factor [Coemansia sp. RSA 2711]KAJ2302538.1 RNA-splicing factor [Coemansia sp. RSA 2706]KAJ2307140.1 RNA-splicing factor [Coemansia sp. RSA 2705]KAJ2314738.1 RNA-splicing factor [Coemansia sp. RSA 2704]KAJ2322662.1 RNA-splicing factor [Coemansia sp. RSA 2702]KAJ2364318.1 RNA-splicing factor [Coemansia sp. RSA 2610]KAJ2725861.1 RNA-splicing factor [Coemansia sp. Cherry 401B]